MTHDQFVQDLQDVEWIIQSMPGDGQRQLDALAARYWLAPPPIIGIKATMCNRMRLLTHDLVGKLRTLGTQSWRSKTNETLSAISKF